MNLLQTLVRPQLLADGFVLVPGRVVPRDHDLLVLVA